MAFKFSTGLRKYQIYDGSVLSALDDCVITLYSGPVPLSPNDALSVNNEKLCIITGNGSAEPLEFEEYSPVKPTVLSKNTSQAWEGDVLSDGVVTFFRVEKADDTGEASSEAIRIQGTVGDPSSDLVISDDNLVQGALQRLEYFSMTLVEYA